MAAAAGGGGGEGRKKWGAELKFRKGSKSKSLSEMEFQPLTEDK